MFGQPPNPYQMPGGFSGFGNGQPPAYQPPPIPQRLQGMSPQDLHGTIFAGGQPYQPPAMQQWGGMGGGQWGNTPQGFTGNPVMGGGGFPGPQMPPMAPRPMGGAPMGNPPQMPPQGGRGLATLMNYASANHIQDPRGYARGIMGGLPPGMARQRYGLL